MRDDELERLFRTYHAPLVRYLTRRLGDRDWAEEVAQEVFLRALRQDSLTSERSWLFAVATNLVRDEARRTARQRAHLRVLAEQERDTVVEMPPTTAERAHEQALARQALDGLAEKDRLALLMREEGFKYEEIARVIGVAPASVGTLIARALRKFTALYEANEVRK